MLPDPIERGARARACGASAATPSGASSLSATRRVRPGRVLLALLICVAASATGCGTLIRNPVPAELTTKAIVPGLPDVRGWAAHASRAMQDDLVLSYKQESRADFPVGSDGRVQYSHLLLSGGGANGAFGSGLLNGWTKAGTRPVFKIVTGVSTGALMAPYAFLGPKYDNALRELYTTTRSQNIFVSGSLFGMISQLFFGEALTDTGPLASMIAQHVDEQFVREVAQAHQQGRRLYIGTADLDAQRFVVWNMGLIAQASYPDKVRLFRKIMLASASIPVVFPPVFFDVEAGGRLFDEMHVDGGVAAMVFFNAGLFSPLVARNTIGAAPGYDRIFVIHNGQLAPPAPTPTPRTVRGISSRVLEAAGRSAVIGDLFRIYTIALREGAEYRWVTIPDDVSLRGDEFFDPVLMTSLYELGFKRGLAGGEWNTRLPGEIEHLRSRPE
jgi:predicted acylesterase/phospholipase RssA